MIIMRLQHKFKRPELRTELGLTISPEGALFAK